MSQLYSNTIRILVQDSLNPIQTKANKNTIESNTILLKEIKFDMKMKNKVFQTSRRSTSTSIPMFQFLLLLVMLHIRVDADERAEEESCADPVLGNLVMDLPGQILPETRHNLLLER